MKNLLSLFLVLFIVWNSSAQMLGVAVASPTTTTAFSCLLNQGISLLIIRVYKANDTIWGIDKDSWQNLDNANAVSSLPSNIHLKGRFKIYAYMQLCRNSDAASQVSDMIDNTSPRTYKAIYLKIQPSANPECQWEGKNYTPEQNCAFLTSALSALTSNHLIQTYSTIVGVFSTANIWGRFFGTACDSIGGGSSNIALWYANYHTDGQVDSNQSFFDFVPFGGWSYPNLKQTQGNTTATNLCNSGWHVYLDHVWAQYYN